MAGTRVLEPKETRKPAEENRAEYIPVVLVRRPARLAFRILQFGFVVAPILAGLDKFFQVMTNWDRFLAPGVEKLLPFSAHTFMQIAGGIEIAAGVLVAVLPEIGGYVVAGWLCGIILNLLAVPGYYDIALRDLGLALGALALALLAREFRRPRLRKEPASAA